MFARFKALLVGIWQREPARVVAGAVSVVVVALGALGITESAASVESVVVAVLAVLFGGEATRSQVTPH